MGGLAIASGGVASFVVAVSPLLSIPADGSTSASSACGWCPSSSPCSSCGCAVRRASDADVNSGRTPTKGVSTLTVILSWSATVRACGPRADRRRRRVASEPRTCSARSRPTRPPTTSAGGSWVRRKTASTSAEETSVRSSRSRPARSRGSSSGGDVADTKECAARARKEPGS